MADLAKQFGGLPIERFGRAAWEFGKKGYNYLSNIAPEDYPYMTDEERTRMGYPARRGAEQPLARAEAPTQNPQVGPQASPVNKPANKPKTQTASQEASKMKKILADALARRGTINFRHDYNNPNMTLEQVMKREAQEDLKKAPLPEITKEGALQGVAREDQRVQPQRPKGTLSKVGGAISNVGKFLSDPVIRYRMGNLAQAIGGVEDPRLRKPLGQRLGAMGAMSAQQQVMSKILTGQPVSAAEARILSPEQTMQLAQLIVQREQLKQNQERIALEGRRVTSQEKHQGSLAKQSEAMTRKILHDLDSKDLQAVVVDDADTDKIRLYSYNKDTGTYELKEEINKNKLTDSDLAKLGKLYKTGDLNRMDRIMSELFYPYAVNIDKPTINNPLEAQAYIQKVPGVIRKDQDLRRAWDSLQEYKIALMKEGQYSVDELIQKMTAAMKNRNTKYYVPPLTEGGNYPFHYSVSQDLRTGGK